MGQVHLVEKDEKARSLMKILITIWHKDIAPRFDLASEVLMAETDGETGEIKSKKTMVLPSTSAEELCRFILSEGVETVVCGGIENEYYRFLVWKHVKVVDSVIGPYAEALERAAKGALKEGAVLEERREEA